MRFCHLPNPLWGPPQVFLFLRPNLAFFMVFFRGLTEFSSLIPSSPAYWFILPHSVPLCRPQPRFVPSLSPIRVSFLCPPVPCPCPFRLPPLSLFPAFTQGSCLSLYSVLPAPSLPQSLGPVQDGRARPSGPPLAYPSSPAFSPLCLPCAFGRPPSPHHLYCLHDCSGSLSHLPLKGIRSSAVILVLALNPLKLICLP